MWHSRTFWKVFLTYGVLWLLLVGVLGTVIVRQVERVFLAHLEESLQAKADLLAAMVRGVPASRAGELQERIAVWQQETGRRATLIAADGTVLADSEVDPRRHPLENHRDRPEVRQARESDVGVSRRRHSTTTHQEMMYVARRTDDDQGAVAFVRVALSTERVEDEVAAFQRLTWLAGGLIALAGMALIFWLARRMALTLHDFTRAATRIAAGDYGHRVFTTGPAELVQLAQTFNHMSARLSEQFRRLEEDREQLRTILSGMVEGVVALDADQRILFVNDRAAQLLEFQAETAVGRRLWEVVRQRGLQDVVGRALAEPEPCQEELHWNSPTTRSVTVHAARLPGEPPRGAVLVLHDTTNLRRLERLRQEFVANVSHELKTPLSVIKACVETLLEGAANDPEHRGRFLDQVGEQADRLHALILDLLSLARIEGGDEVLEFEAVPLGAVVACCVERHRARAAAKNQTLEAAGDGEATAWADEEAVSQILDNLVDNALKYTPPGGRIRVRWGAEDDQAYLEVQDTGIGIPEQDLPRIFERFYRVDKARSRALGGTGLGLSIVKHLTQAMHGSIRATSRPGQGTTFLLRLPLAPAAPGVCTNGT